MGLPLSLGSLSSTAFNFEDNRLGPFLSREFNAEGFKVKECIPETAVVQSTHLIIFFSFPLHLPASQVFFLPPSCTTQLVCRVCRE